VVTQICFDPGALLRWMARVRSLGIHLPVHAGVPGAVTRRKLLEIGLQIGIGDSIRYLSKHGGLVARLVRRGTYRPDAFLAGLSGETLDLAGFHLNTFNQLRGTERWRRRAVEAYRAEAVPNDREGA
jgi:methylenetetrahydrofolate reductase (NADPH)